MFIRFIHILLITILTYSFLITEAISGLPLSNKSGIELFFYSSDNPTQFIIIEKRSQTLRLFEQGKSLKLIKKLFCATGQNPGTKQISGDAKTPEGVYFITEVFQDSEITVFGSRAFHLDYPNKFDQYAGNNGDGIFIHGTNKTLAPFSTNGCITLNNEDLDTIAPYLTVKTIPIIVVDSLEDDLSGKQFSMKYGDPIFTAVMDTLGLSARDLRPEQIEKLQFFKVEDQGLALIRYDEFDANSMQFKYDKRAFLKPSPTKNWRTLFATHKQDMIPSLVAIKPIKNTSTKAKQNNPVTTQPAITTQPIAINKGGDLLDFIEKWRKSWSGKNIDTYMDCYSNSFKSGGLDKKGWRRKKAYLNKKYEFIQVTIDNIVVKREKNRAKISFFQTYQSDLYKTSGTKNLQLVRKDGKWMIEKEYM